MNSATRYEQAYADWKAVRDNIKTPQHYRDAIIGVMENRPPPTPCPIFDLLGYRPGELTEYAGINGHGKSLLTGQIIQMLAAQGFKQFIVSPEMRPERTLLRMFRQAYGHTPDPLRDKYNVLRWLDWADKLMPMYDADGEISPESVMGAYLVAVQDFGVSHVWIDNLMLVVPGEDTYNEQKAFVKSLKQLAKETNTHCHLVLHARKGKTEDDPIGKFDIRGAAAITDAADNVVIIQRNTVKDRKRAENRLTPAEDADEADSVFNLCKQRNGDYDNRIKPLWLDMKSRAFCDDSRRRRPEMVPEGFFTGTYEDQFEYV